MIISSKICSVVFLILLVSLVPSLNRLHAQNDLERRQLHEQAYSDQYKIKINIEALIREIVNGEPVEIEGDYVFSKNVLPEFYANREYMPAWDNYDALMDAVGALERSYEDGLNPEDYHHSTLFLIIDKIKQKLSKDEPDYAWIAAFDILVTDAVLLYAYHLLEGKIDPESLDPNWNYTFREISPDAPYDLERNLEAGTISAALAGLRPQIPIYQMYIDLLAKYRAIAEKGGWESIQEGGAIKPGDTDERIPSIRKRLQITGELSSAINMMNEDYDDVLIADIKKFQNRNALEADGIIGKGTFAALNVPVEKKIEILRVNMERNRWIMANISDDYIIVNIAAFKAYFFKNNELRFTTNVQVGKTYHKTPVFRERLRYIEFNPTWTVPVSITRSSIIPKMKEDASYLDNHHYELLDGAGNIVPNSSVDYDNLSVSEFPYTVRQKPGPWNALGEVKFIFPNKHAVYLHDTPSKSLFDRQERAFSHGCIRTQHPLDLAEVLLEGSEWTREKIDATIKSRKTTRAFPDRVIDVMLLYWTAGYYQGDGIGFFKDVYDRDARVLEQLNKKDTGKPKARKL